METRKTKTVPMLKHKVQWNDVADVLNITKPTLVAWRNSGDPNKNQIIDEAVQEVIKKVGR